jgi:hypothetical protein
MIAKFQSLQVNKGMVDALKVKLENGKEKLRGVTVQFDKVNITTITIEETMATKATNKMKFIKYGKSITKGKLKAICTIEQVHPAFQTKEPFGLELGPYGICGN